MKNKKYPLIAILLITITACSRTPVPLGNVNLTDDSSFVTITADGSNTIITKINGETINYKRYGRYLVKPGRTIIEAHPLYHPKSLITWCFIFEAGRRYEVRPNFSRTGAPIVASTVGGILYGSNAQNCS